jgi:hypothetical protein
MTDNSIKRATEYFMANDNHEDCLEGELADELLRFDRQLVQTLHMAHYALLRSASVEGRPGYQEPWNEGGYGYEANQAVSRLLQIMAG